MYKHPRQGNGYWLLPCFMLATLLLTTRHPISVTESHRDSHRQR